MTNDVQDEMEVLAVTIKDMAYMKVAVDRGIGADHFTDDRAWVWRTAVEGYERTKGRELPGAKHYARCLIRDFPRSEDKQFVVQKLIQRIWSMSVETPLTAIDLFDRLHRVFIVRGVLNQLVHKVDDRNVDEAADVLDQARQELRRGAEGGGELISLADDFEEYADTDRSLLARSFLTPWPTINRMTAGGLHIGDLGLLAAPINTGKSAISVDLSWTALKRNADCVVLHVPIEETIDSTKARFYGRISGINRARFVNGSASLVEREHLKAACRAEIDALSRLRISRLGVDSFAAVSQAAEEMRERHPGKNMMVIIDSPDDLVPETKMKIQDRRHAVDLVVTAIEQMVEKPPFDPCAVWMTTQANRKSVEKNDIDILSPTESMKKAAKAAVMLGLTDGELMDDGQRRMHVVLRKNRQGEKHFKLNVIANLGTCEFVEVGGADQSPF